MKTDDLVALLSTNPEPVDRGLVVRALLVALGTGLILALGIAIFGLGVRPDIMMYSALSFVVAKVSFAVGIFSLAFIYLAKLARPGGERKSRYLVAVPFLVIVALAVISLGLAPSSHWNKMIVGDEWLECLVSIPVVAQASALP